MVCMRGMHVCVWCLDCGDTQRTTTCASHHARMQCNAGIVSRFVTYPGTTHGFAVRGSKTDDVVRAARDDALRQAVHFFHEVLLSCSGGGSGAGGGGAVHDSGGGSIADGGV